MWGKILGGLIGLGIGLLLQSGLAALALAGVGAVLGWLTFDREPVVVPPAPLPPAADELPSPRGPVPRTNPDTVLARLLCPLFIEVARADAPVTQAEIRVIREFFSLELKFDEESLEAVRVALKDALAHPPFELTDATTRARAKLAPASRMLLVNALYELALVDGELKRTEADALKQIVSSLNLSEEQLQQITTMHLGSGLQHYQSLGLTEQASDDDIRAAFKRLAAEHHPDRAAHLGPGPAQQAAERFRQVKQAYEELKKLRGL